MVTKTMSGTFTKPVGGTEGIIEAIVGTTNILDSQGDVIVPGAWLGAIDAPDRVRVSRYGPFGKQPGCVARTSRSVTDPSLHK